MMEIKRRKILKEILKAFRIQMRLEYNKIYISTAFNVFELRWISSETVRLIVPR